MKSLLKVNYWDHSMSGISCHASSGVNNLTPPLTLFEATMKSWHIDLDRAASSGSTCISFCSEVADELYCMMPSIAYLISTKGSKS